MTGNVVFLGFALAGAPGLSAPASLAALGAFLRGSAGRRAHRRPVGGHRAGTCGTATTTSPALAGAAVRCRRHVGQPVPHGARYALIVALALAMGVAERDGAATGRPRPHHHRPHPHAHRDRRRLPAGRRNEESAHPRLISVTAMFTGALVGARLVTTSTSSSRRDRRGADRGGGAGRAQPVRRAGRLDQRAGLAGPVRHLIWRARWARRNRTHRPPGSSRAAPRGRATSPRRSATSCSTETGGARRRCSPRRVAALLWANSPWSDSYESVWTTELSIQLGDARARADLRDWVNEGLMTFFFLVVGLEAKRELDLGELRERQRLAIPVVAALGGMAVPVAIYLAINAGGDGGARLGRGDVDRHRVRARRARARWRRARDAPARVPAHARRGRRPRRAARDRDRLHRARRARAARGRGRAVRACCSRCASRRSRGARRRRRLLGVAIWVAMFESGIDPVIAGLADRPGHERLPAGARRPRARHRADALVPRAADARARALGAARAWRRRSRPTSACSTACTRGRAT